MSIDATLSGFPQPQDDRQQDTILVGKTDRRIFWLLILGSCLVVAFILHMISSGAIALAAAAPVPFTIQADTINGSDFKLYPGLSQADNSTPIAANQMNCTINNLVISKTLQIPVVGNITVKFSAGSKTAATLNGLTTDVSALNASSASFQNMSLTSGGNGFDQQASSATLNAVTINSPYLMVNSITLPGLAISILQ